MKWGIDIYISPIAWILHSSPWARRWWWRLDTVGAKPMVRGSTQRPRRPDQVWVQEPPRLLVAVGDLLETKVESRRQGRRRTDAVGISSVHPLQRPSFSHLLHLLKVSEPLLEESYGRRVDDGRGGLAAAVPSHWRLERLASVWCKALLAGASY